MSEEKKPRPSERERDSDHRPTRGWEEQLREQSERFDRQERSHGDSKTYNPTDDVSSPPPGGDDE